MSDTLEARVKAIFQRALEVDGPGREAFLERACNEDASLRARVDTLLAAYDDVGSFLAEPEDATAAGEYDVGAIIDRYKLLQRIGEGGFGTVYMAEQTEPVRRKVALKITKLGMDTKEVIARFEAERQALAMMDHPNIAKVLDAGATPSGRPYFVMELVRGIAITEYCDQAGVPAAQRLDLFRTVCDAVQHAHQKGVIHRDIKPSNVLVTLHDGVPTPKVIDFGIAKATDQRLTEKTLFTELHQFVGTPEYMSPEQAELSGLDIDTRADVYSLGVLLYELLTGTKPFELKTLLSEGFGAVLQHIREVDPPKPSSRVSTMQEERLVTVAEQRGATPGNLGKLIRGDLDWIVMKALEKDRSRRYETANALAMDIERYQSDEPVLARPPSAAYRVSKYVRRHRVGVGAAAAVVLALVVGVVLAVRGYVEADQQLGRAIRAERLASAEAKEANAQRTKALDAQQRADRNAKEAKAERTKALAEKDRADQQAEEAKSQRAEALEEKQRADREAAEAARRREDAERAVGILSRLMAAYHEELGHKPRERYSSFFLTGLLAALESKNASDVFFFLEQARVDSLLGLMDDREAINHAQLPETLRAVEVQARAGVVEARKRYALARSRHRRQSVRAARKALDGANERLQMAVLQTQRLARATVAAHLDAPVGLRTLQQVLQPHQAYVAYALLPDRALAFVATASTARIVDLGSPVAITDAVASLNLERGESDPASGVAKLQELLITPLMVRDPVHQLLVSAEGPLMVTPFCLLAPSKEVAFVPSASAYVKLLKRGEAPGRDVLAVGDPDYGHEDKPMVVRDGQASSGGHPQLPRLPATRKEVMAIGSVVLLGKDATVGRFKKELGGVRRWRGVHLACHGLMNGKQPLLSSLVLTPGEDDDGLLRALDISQLRVDADIVALSACESARSEILQGGGIGSLTRAFLYAGASRLLVSRYKVDDAATVALMTKFYELWNPRDVRRRMGVVAALKRAQAFVRDFEKTTVDAAASQAAGKQIFQTTRPWQHPYYWAGWSIWGLVE